MLNAWISIVTQHLFSLTTVHYTEYFNSFQHDNNMLLNSKVKYCTFLNNQMRENYSADGFISGYNAI